MMERGEEERERGEEEREEEEEDMGASNLLGLPPC